MNPTMVADLSPAEWRIYLDNLSERAEQARREQMRSRARR